MIQVQF